MTSIARIRCRFRELGAVFLVCFILGGVARADEKPPSADLPGRVETRHTQNAADGAIAYSAIAEPLPLRDAKGETTASVFTVSYLADTEPGRTRPVAFLVNGGPGAASVFLHLGAVGPRVVDTPESGAAPPPPVRLIDNASSWLPFTDLVFIDPVGAGFSHGRARDKEDNPDKPFWAVRSDLNSLASVIRLWLTRHQRWNSPVYLVGESYGGFRAAALAHNLVRDVGLTVSGLVLVSPALDMAMLNPNIGNLVAPATELPSFAASAAAFSGGRFDAEAVERYAMSDYIAGLANLPGKPGPGDALIAKVAGLIGLPAETVTRERGRVSRELFRRELRRPQGEILSAYDATVGRPATAKPWDDHAGDPILDSVVPAYTSGFQTYAAETLGYRTEQPYRVLSGEVSRQWQWEGSREGEGGLGLALSSLQSALLASPKMRVLVVNGRYDLVTPYLGSRWLLDQISIPPTMRDAIRVRVYEGGHMMYMRPSVRAAFARDVSDLFAGRDAAPSQ
jgi:carboxypeptidase C (cathepsin A)